MKLKINDQVNEVPYEYTHKLLSQGFQMGMAEYEKLKQQHMDWVIGAKVPARGILQSMEQQATATHGKEAGLHYRPPRNSDPNVFLASIFFEILEKVMEHATFAIDTDTTGGSQTVTAFNLSIEGQSEGGERLGTDRNAGLRENDSTQVS